MNNKITKMLLPAAVLLSTFSFAFADSSEFRNFAQANTPDALVRNLYKLHDQDLKSSRDRILNGKSRVVLDKYFDKNLADLMWKDLTTHKDEVGVLDFDPLYNAQDFDIKKLVIGQPKIVSEKATVVVTFENAGRKDRLSYSLAQQNSVWKISNITYTDGTSLLKYFRDDAKK